MTHNKENRLAAIEGVSMDLERQIKALPPSATVALSRLTLRLKENRRRYAIIEAGDL